jgi:hypothetical protein
MTTLSDLIDEMAKDLNEETANLGDWLACWLLLSKKGFSHQQIHACIDDAMARAREERMREAA